MTPGDQEWGSGPEKVLLLHGFSGRPSDLRELGQHLAFEGYHCLAPELPGHDPALSTLPSATARDWRIAAGDALARLRRESGKKVSVVGFSLGGALAISLAGEVPESVDRLVLLAPALRLSGSSRLYLQLFRWRLASWLLPTVSKGAPDLTNEGALPAYRGTDRLSTSGARLLGGVMRAAWRNLPKVEAPTKVFWGEKDRVVPRSAAEAAASAVGQPLVVLPSSGHHLALDVDRERLFREVSRFLAGEEGGPDQSWERHTSSQ